ncbi:Similar to Skp1: S-phase kinase-associated protein 1 (Rattus norvegicus) [Cotesia congregata]|uniref:Similar to Skp1: S-phase kinase-associated protein 1 (Rattus norvegicus) n=1 Tax=Cotesia congregata TaxID=51543 RepID=A0A8J2H3C5_COTCN|nr:Similar to Skp1: S-phase kinase-associated protein 1 (Rattus norvegicus) [Cotesia congregata]
MAIIKLKSNDGVVFKVDVEILKCSTTIKTMLESLGEDETDEEVPIPLPIINSVILDKIIQWAIHYKNDLPFEENNEDAYSVKTDDMCAWNAEFFKMEQGMLLDLIEAANYLDIKPLMETICKTIAHKMKGKTTEQLRTQFGAVNDFTPEEEEKVRKFGK